MIPRTFHMLNRTVLNKHQLFAPTANLWLQQSRGLKVHEYAGMEIMSKHGINVPQNGVASTLAEVDSVLSNVIGEGNDCVIKAQVLAGGRGLGSFKGGLKGGVHVCTRHDDVRRFAEGMLGDYLVTKQTGEDGIVCTKVLLAERVYMRREMYVSILLDRAYNGPVLIACPSGGTSIEDIAVSHPDQMLYLPINIHDGMSQEMAEQVASHLGFVKAENEQGFNDTADLVKNLYQMFIDTDSTLVEVNPLAELQDGRVMVCDAKLNFDDNAEFRHKDIFAYRDYTQEDPREVEAAKSDLNYIGLDGDIGCMVNGAGLAMATMDLIKLMGGEPANFLDVGGGANENQVEQAFHILNDDPNVRTILVNIFGGIMRCDVIAMGILQAAKKLHLKKPIVIRLQGTKVEEAKVLIEASDFKMVATDDLEDAARKAVRISHIVHQAEELSMNVSFHELPL
jgi:succinyl-CoA synthetase beta subunit